jgi:acyl carrier protein
VPDQVSLRDDLHEFLAGLGIELPGDSADELPLFDTGRLDSQGLYNLVLWAEERMGHPIDLTVLDLPRDWATAGDIVRFLEAGGAGQD